MAHLQRQVRDIVLIQLLKAPYPLFLVRLNLTIITQTLSILTQWICLLIKMVNRLILSVFSALRKRWIVSKINEMTEEFREECTKCLESPAYFYNNYCVIRDKTTGEVSKPVPVTDEQIEIGRQVHEAQRRLRQPFGSGELPVFIKKLIEKYKTTCE